MNLKNFYNLFLSPPPGYGNVPFYWWNGEELDRNRFIAQLDRLHEKGISGMQVNFAHANKGGIDDEDYGGHGKTLPSNPPLFSEKWWDFWQFAVEECAKRDMSLGMGDYTVAWIGNGYYTDEISAMPDMKAKELFCETINCFAGSPIHIEAGNNTIAIIRYPEGKIECAKNLLSSANYGKILFTPTEDCKIYRLYTYEAEKSIDPLNPDCGRLVVEKYFKKFEQRNPGKCGCGLNYFFQDELMFGTNCRRLWSKYFPKQFITAKGYDIIPLLPALFDDIGNITAKVRLDYADVKTSLIEECYFKLIYNFHADRGMIYGCDQNSRGLSPDEYSDYFRTIRWFTAPGNDTPGRSADLLKVKVNSSIAHLYERPRVWLEGYHSSGWGTTLESITSPTGDNFIYGANLLNLHGLYYTTLGGFWEWAPPDFHFRMPYWDDEKSWLKKQERMSWLLSQGKHRCDAAVFYPVSSFDYGENSKECLDSTFSVARKIYEKGIDFDFIDFQSIENAEIQDSSLCVAGEKYKVLIFAKVDAIRYGVIEKLKQFVETGGKVIFLDYAPYLSDRMGANDEVLAADIKVMTDGGNAKVIATIEQAIEFITKEIQRDFAPLNASVPANVHHRVTDFGDLYFIRNAEQGQLVRFNVKGNAYILDALTANIHPLKIDSINHQNGTIVRLPFAAAQDTLILFTEDKLECNGSPVSYDSEIAEPMEVIPMPMEWNFDLIPTLDNKYGDFYLPASEGSIGAQARFFDCTELESVQTAQTAAFDEGSQMYAHTKAFKKLELLGVEDPGEVARAFAGTKDLLNLISFDFNGKNYKISDCDIWDRYGCIDSSETEQGFHGLKGTIFNDNIYFKRDTVFLTSVCSDECHRVKMGFGKILPVKLFINGIETDVKDGSLELPAGQTIIVAAYSFAKSRSNDLRSSETVRRTHILFEKEDVPCPTPYFPLSVKWYTNNRYLKFEAAERKSGIFAFKFNSIPALKALKIRCFGELLKLSNNGEKSEIISSGTTPYGANIYEITLNNVSPKISEVMFCVKAMNGYNFAGVIPEPIELTQAQGVGKIQCGDWSKTGALICYSGKGKYTAGFNINSAQIGKRIKLNLGKVAATCSIKINEKDCGSLTYSPYICDITDAVIAGENLCEITVANTLCNHYSTIPSRYSNFPADAVSGLIGPVTVNTFDYE